MAGIDDQQAFSGIRVFDATQGIAGPHSTMLLAQHGADVVKMEPPEGDWGRVLGKTIGQTCVHFLAFNRGKRSICLDAKSPEGRRITRDLVAKADVFVESFRPGAVANIGLSYEEVREINPEIIYASISGFGQSGPFTKRPTVDLLIQAYSGMMVMNKGNDGLPHRQNMIAVDVLTGLYAFQALSTAIIRKIRFGKGSRLDISLMQAAAAFQAAKVMEFHEANGKPLPLYMPSGMMPTADGMMVISGMRSAHFKALCEVVGRPDMAEDPRYETQELRLKNSPQMMADLRTEFPRRTTAEWLKDLHARGVMAERVLDYGQWLEEEHVKAVKSVAWTEFDGFGSLPVANIPGVTPIQDFPESTYVPLMGEDGPDILRGIGYSDAEIGALVAGGKVQVTTR